MNIAMIALDAWYLENKMKSGIGKTYFAVMKSLRESLNMNGLVKPVLFSFS